MKQFRVLVSCEFSGIVRNAFSAMGCDAWSCDVIPTESRGNHVQCDVRAVLDINWDLMIAHPPCTFLTNSAEWAYGPGPYHQRVKPETLVGEARVRARKEAIEFAKGLWAAPIPRIALEDPIGVLTKELGKPQIIQPHQFGAEAS